MPTLTPMDDPGFDTDFWSDGAPVITTTQIFGSAVPIDVNGDGHTDLVLTYGVGSPDYPLQPLQIYLGDGAGHFTDATATYFPGGAPLAHLVRPSQALVADFNGDGRPDLYLLNEGDDSGSPTAGGLNSLFLSSGSSGFVDASSNIVGVAKTDWYGGAAADIDGDGDIDIVTVALNQGTVVGVALQINDGTGHFTVDNSRLPASALPQLASGPQPGPTGYDNLYKTAVFFDADGDGDKDLFMGSWVSQNNPSLLLFNDGTGHFSETASSHIGPNDAITGTNGPEAAASFDANSDGIADLVILDLSNDAYAVRILINDGHGNLSDQTASRILDSPLVFIASELSVADINNDGYDDITVLDQGQKTVFLNDGTGHFKTLLPDFLPETWPNANFDHNAWMALPAVADLNGDGRTDMIGWSDFVDSSPFDGTRHFRVLYGHDPSLTQTGTATANTMLGDASNESISGLGGNDVIFAAAGNDTLNGGAGNDYLNGGAGIDTANYSVTSGGATWTRQPDGAWTVNAGAEGVDTLSGVEVLHFTDRDVHLDTASRTFSGDGTSDILFRRSDGIMASWEVTGSTIVSAAFLPAAGAEWTPLDSGDFNGDGRADVLWRRNDGLIYSWEMNGGSVAATHALAGIGAEWSFLGAGDFNGDLSDDLAWQRNDGIVYIWQMGAGAIQSASVVAGLGPEWQMQGVGDFNGDGRDDFLWRRSDTGEMVIWNMNGAAIAGAGYTSTQIGLDWSVAGVGDTNGDGRDDIILQRDSNGTVRVWSMDNATVSASANVGTASPAQWTLHNIGDYNGDGRDDILWQRADGTVYVWLLNGTSIIGSGALSGVGAEWDIIGGG